MQREQFKAKVYKKRWFVLALLVCLNFLMAFLYVTFGLLNNVLVAYFHTSYAAVDWVLLGHNAGIFMTAPLIGWLASREIISCKGVLFASACFQALNTAFVIVGFTWPSLFAFVMAGQILGGVSTAFLWTVPSALAQIWFPESQIGLATGIGFFGLSFGGVAGYIMPSQILSFPLMNFSNFTSRKWSNSTSLNWFQRDKYIYQWLFLTMLFISTTTAVLLLIVPAVPEKSPSVAQYLKRKQRRESMETRYVQSSATIVKQLLFDKTFLALTFASAITMYGITFVELCIGAIIVDKMHETNNSQAEKLSSYLMGLYAVGATIGNIISGYVMDKFKKYYLQAILGAVITWAGFVAICILVYLQALSPLYFLLLFWGFSSKFIYLPLVDSIMQHTYPIDPVTVMSMFAFFQNVVTVSFVEIGRQIIYHAHLMSGLMFICALMLLVVLVSVFFKAKNNRLSAEESKNYDGVSDATPLLNREMSLRLKATS